LDRLDFERQGRMHRSPGFTIPRGHAFALLTDSSLSGLEGAVRGLVIQANV
jgi:hypothetical protein